MTQNADFTLVGIRPEPPRLPRRRKRLAGFPWVSALLLAAIVLCCLLAELWMTREPTYLDLAHCDAPPSREFLFGTDSLGRDIFSGIWYGGRVSLLIGFLSTLLSTALALVYGACSGLAPAWLDALLMRIAELLVSIPGLLLVLFLQAILGEANVLTLSVVLGVTGWPAMAKVVRTQVRQLRQSEYVVAARCMGGGFFHLLGRHLAPGVLSSISFMVVMQVRSAIAAESTLSFMGMGLPLEIVSWGSMLSLAEKALLSGSWWSILIPGAFLLALLLCLTSLGNYLRRQSNRKESNL